MPTLTDTRADFPILTRTVRNGKPLVYLDSAATVAAPSAGARRRGRLRARPQRGGPARRPPDRRRGDRGCSRALAPRWRASSSAARPARSCGPATPRPSINLVANGMANASAGIGGSESARFRVGPGDSIVVTETEHHANLDPVAAAVCHARAPRSSGSRWTTWAACGLESARHRDRRRRTKLVAFTARQNVTGIITDVAAIVAQAPREVGALTVPRRVPVRATPSRGLCKRSAWTSSHSRATRCSAPPASAPCGGARHSWTRFRRRLWRRHRQGRSRMGDHLARRAAPLRGGLAARRSGRGDGRGRRVPHGVRHGQRGRARARLAQILREGVSDLPGVRLARPGGRPANALDVLGLAAVVVDGVHASRRRARCSTTQASPCASVTTATSPFIGASACQAPPARAPTCTRPRTRLGSLSTPSPRSEPSLE